MRLPWRWYQPLVLLHLTFTHVHWHLQLNIIYFILFYVIEISNTKCQYLVLLAFFLYYQMCMFYTGAKAKVILVWKVPPRGLEPGECEKYKLQAFIFWWSWLLSRRKPDSSNCRVVDYKSTFMVFPNKIMKHTNDSFWSSVTFTYISFHCRATQSVNHYPRF